MSKRDTRSESLDSRNSARKNPNPQKSPLVPKEFTDCRVRLEKPNLDELSAFLPRNKLANSPVRTSFVNKIFDKFEASTSKVNAPKSSLYI